MSILDGLFGDMKKQLNLKATMEAIVIYQMPEHILKH